MELVETLEIDTEEREIADAYAREQCAANAEGIDGINSNLDNQGLLNKVTEMRQGRWNISSGVSEGGDYYVSSKESISCNGNSNIKLKCDNAEAFDIVFFNGSSFISGESKNGSELLFTTPSNATSFKFNIYNGNKLTPQNVGKIEVYVDSQIEQLKNDLSELLKVIPVSLESITVSGNSSTTVSLPQEYIDAGYVIANILSKPDTGLSYTTGSETSIIIRNNTDSAIAFAPTTTVKVLIAKIG